MTPEVDNLIVSGFGFPESIVTLGLETPDPRCTGEDPLSDSVIILQGFCSDTDDLRLITQGFEASFGDAFPEIQINFDSFIQVVHNFDSPINLKDNIRTKFGVWI